MKNTSKTLVFFGTEDFSARSLQALLEAKFSISLVITKPDTQSGRGQKVSSPLVKTIANTHGIPVLQPENLQGIIPTIQKLKNPAGVLVSYGKIIPKNVIDLFSPGIINLHPSLLPKYRGPSPIETAILNGDLVTGVSIMQLTPKMDAGPVYASAKVLLTGSEKQETVYAFMAEIGNPLLIKTLPSILNGSLQPIPQDDSTASYCRLITKADGIIDWTKPAKIIEREIRAYHLWPKSHTTLGKLAVIIRQAGAIPNHAKSPGVIKIVDLFDDMATLIIGTGDGDIEVDKIQPIGKKEMPVQAFLKGYRSRLPKS